MPAYVVEPLALPAAPDFAPPGPTPSGPAAPGHAPSSGLVRSGQIEAIAQISRAAHVELFGNDDLAQDAEQMAIRLANQRQVRQEVLLALDRSGQHHPAGILGAAWLDLPLSDNTHTAWLDIFVRPEHRRQGIATALWDTALERIDAAGRTTVFAETAHTHEPPEESAHALVPPTGAGRLDARDAAARFAQHIGCDLVQAERHSIQHLPVDPGHVQQLLNDATEAAGDQYELVCWTDAAPEELVDDLIVLLRAMSTDPPMGTMDYHEESWDAMRVRNMEAQRVRSGRQPLTTAVRHRPTGTLAGFTELLLDTRKPEVAHQENTIVLARHRGHRLGMLLKATNLAWLQAESPGVRRVHTWNAEENAHMLAVNVALGYRPASTWGVWQHERDRTGPG